MIDPEAESVEQEQDAAMLEQMEELQMRLFQVIYDVAELAIKERERSNKYFALKAEGASDLEALVESVK